MTLPISLPHGDPANFEEAIENVREYTLERFKTAIGTANREPPTPAADNADPQTKEDRKKEIAAYENAKKEMAATLAQIGDTQRQAAEAKGYAAIADLMGTMETTASSICSRIKYLMGSETSTPASSDAIAEIESLGRVLNALAALSPAELWKKAPSEDGSSA